MSSFTFKKFVIQQDRTAMKVGTDGVLLGAWSVADGASGLLDIGTGTGLVALMMAQRYPQLQVDAIEIDCEAASEAAANAEASPFAGRVKVHNVRLQDYFPVGLYDAIVCNPPYFTDSLKCPDRQRSAARHNDSLTLVELVRHSSRLLRTGGTLSVVLPASEKERFTDMLYEYHFNVSRITMVCPTPVAMPKRMLLSAVYRGVDTAFDGIGSPVVDMIAIEENRHRYTPEYIALTRDFYLKM